MTTYIALLRGINVGGNKIIKMLDLKAMFQALGFANVRTYIQSGNVVFESDEGSVSLLSGVIERQIHEVFGFEVSVIIRTLAEMENVIANDPFQLSEPEEFKRWYVTFYQPSLQRKHWINCALMRMDRIRCVLSAERCIYYMRSV